MDQLRLWEQMGCQIKDDNRKYRAYRLQCKARERKSTYHATHSRLIRAKAYSGLRTMGRPLHLCIRQEKLSHPQKLNPILQLHLQWHFCSPVVTGSVDAVTMAPDPSAAPVDAAVYFRCRKCRKLLFTDGDVLQHELGEGRDSFLRYRQWQATRDGNAQCAEDGREKEQEGIEQDEEADEKRVTLSQVAVATQEVAGMAISTGSLQSQPKSEKPSGKEKEDEVLSEEPAVLGGNPDCHIHVAIPDTPLSAVRQEVASIVARGPTHLSTCTSLFIDPVSWMGPALLGNMEGKVCCIHTP